VGSFPCRQQDNGNVRAAADEKVPSLLAVLSSPCEVLLAPEKPIHDDDPPARSSSKRKIEAFDDRCGRTGRRSRRK